MSTSKLQVLLVDDHAVVRGGLRLILDQTDDMEVASEAEDAEQAILMIRQSEFDVALVDIGLPGKGGLDLLKQIKTERPKLAVLMLSMYAEEVYAVRALKAGASGYLTKNSPPSTLLAAIRKVASGGKHVSPALLERLAVEVGRGRKSDSEALSDREIEVLRRIASGESLNQIAEALYLSPKTVTTYRARIVEKTGLHSNAELTRYALEKGMLS
ncbi:MAG: response regulator transcription factor [Candidatus Accumulibacter phosphatis]|jgi:DNA-binding NarL/FixJ family response regulator|uniref:Response regulator transcription factor n=1 Tax=Candidatus Accumulibacter contiguus TaxID=2954381 RepID=A0ABX1TG41_9PROT|nr:MULTISPECIES: response regulator transcription factor [Candidatus Accumulibacter]MBL8407539.1 response regulator transcription factor [Accumulibacter sp.]NMQ07802.1 response regulator transcription factor [Candidatus Accumulibacter contiguus]HCZ17599.1 DNA-binding response regulator [Accumulibacter sp.]HRF10728.1 response regulator transcription factor [Candidatus Accumulibacter phosphatis]